MKWNLRGAFTLIELLVVVAVIGILASLFLPSLAAAKSKAHRAKCSSNLRQIGLAMILYADDYDGWFPETTHGNPTNRSWIYTMSGYVGEVDAIRICPADPVGWARLTNRASSYVLNEFTSVDEVDEAGWVVETFRNVNRLKQPSQTMTVFTVADTIPPSEFVDHAHSREWDEGWERVLEDIAPDRHRNGRANGERTSGPDNYLHADGHVDVIRAAGLKSRIDRADNFARPPR